ncbi:MAG TPA: wax ester/triacylglycerol synthase family O-acyltransferase [Solirubrobacteraceae bacterium]|nr:wax ester/triacylglycerol synthase family O-acyltransferase [Solirubrobacteraceae bacterium]
MQRLSALDASFLDFEDAVSHMHIGSVGVFEGPAPSREELAAVLTARLPLVPRYRQVVRRAKLGIGRPLWVDDPHFNIDYHVRSTGIPAPGGDGELQRVVARVMSHQLDRNKPLWETWIVEGLDEGRWALISKIHHCMADGVAGTDLITALLDQEPTPAAPVMEATPSAAPSPSLREDTLSGAPSRAQAGKQVGGPAQAGWRAQPPPNALAELTDTFGGLAALPWKAARALSSPGQLLERGGETGRGLLRLSAVSIPPPASSLNGSLSSQRRWSWARAQLSDVKQVGRTLGGTINDVVLACITGGFRALLLSRGESAERVVRTLVPVSVRSSGQRGLYDNRVSAMFADLPVGIEDPVQRLHSIRDQMGALKDSHEAVAGEMLTSLAGLTPPLLLSLAERLATRVPQHNVNTVTTNVPGPRGPLFACGRRMLESFPYVPLGGHVLIGVAIYSYDGACTFGVTGDYDAAPDIDVLCEGIERELGELLARSGPAPSRAHRHHGAHA